MIARKAGGTENGSAWRKQSSLVHTVQGTGRGWRKITHSSEQNDEGIKELVMYTTVTLTIGILMEHVSDENTDGTR